MKRGVALLWGMILSAILMIIAGSMVGYITKESRFSIRIEDSSKAYAAAKSAIDWARTPDVLGVGETKTLVSEEDTSGNNLVYAIVVRTTDTHYESTGFSGEVKRKIEYEQSSVTDYPVVPNSSNVQQPGTGNLVNSNVAFPGANVVSGNTNSFTLQYDFWVTGNTQFEFGLDNAADSEKYIRMGADFGSKTITIKSKDAAGIVKSDSLVIADADLIDKGRAWNYRAEIKYVKDTAASIKVRKIYNRGMADQSYQCLGYKSIDLTGQSFGDLSSFSLAGSANSDIHYLGGGTATSDGSYFQYKDINDQNSYVDNVSLRSTNISFASGGVIPDATATAQPTPIYPSPTCTLTPTRSSASVYNIAWTASNFTSGMKYESTSKINTWNTSGITASGSIGVSLNGGNVTFSMRVTNPAGSTTCTTDVNSGPYYINTITATGVWSPSTTPMRGQNDINFASFIFSSPSANSNTQVNYKFDTAFPLFEKRLDIYYKTSSSNSINANIKLKKNGTYLGNGIDAVITGSVISKSQFVDLNSINTPNGYDEIEIRFTGTMSGSSQTIYIDAVKLS